MLLLLKIKPGHSRDAVIIGNVICYTYVGDSTYVVTYEENFELFDIKIKHVEKVEEINEEDIK